MSEPFFSICITTYNTIEEYMRFCFDSIYAQDYKDWEIVIVDDGSKAETKRYIENEETNHLNIRAYYLQQNTGLYSARSTACKYAKGKYVICLDSDDAFIEPNALRLLHDEIVSLDCDVLMFNSTRQLEKRDRHIQYSELESIQDGILKKEHVLQNFVSTFVLNNIWSKAIRRTLFENEAFPDIHLSMCEDRLKMVQIFFRANRIALLDQVIHYYRPNSTSITKRGFLLKDYQEQVFVEKIVRQYANNNGIDTEKEESIFLATVVSDLMRATYASSDLSSMISMYEDFRDDPFLNEIYLSGTHEDLRSFQRMVLNCLMKKRYRRLYLIAWSLGFLRARRDV